MPNVDDAFPVDGYKDEELVKEYDDVFFQLSSILKQFGTVDDSEGSNEPDEAAISLARVGDIGRYHNICVEEHARSPDLIKSMVELLREYSDGWYLGIESDDYPNGSAYITINQNGDVFGWSDFRAREALLGFGFKKDYSVFQAITWFFQDFFYQRKMRKELDQLYKKAGINKHNH